MPERVMCGVIPRVLLACAHHPKLDDLNSISCLLSMRLYRHANNRKFALKGIDQQPLAMSHDSEVSHDSGASERFEKASFRFLSLPPGKLSYHRDCPVSHSLTGRWKPQRSIPIGSAGEGFVPAELSRCSICL